MKSFAPVAVKDRWGSALSAAPPSSGSWRSTRGSLAICLTSPPHVLRHTVGTVLVREKRVDPFTVQRLLGHASVATTQLYTAPDQIDLEDAVNRLVAVEEPRGRSSK